MHRAARRASIAGLRGAGFYWRCIEALVPLPEPGPVQLGPNSVLVFDPDDWISVNAYRGLYERPECRIFSALIKQGDVVVDVGANIGALTSLFARKVGNSGSVIAIEPSPRCLPKLEKWIEAGGVDNVSLHRVAVGKHPGHALLSGYEYYSHSGGGTLKPGRTAYGVVDVDVVRLDSILDEEAIEYVTLLKLDVEGSEPDILDDLRRLADSQIGYVMAEVSPGLGTAQWFGELVARLRGRYAAFAIKEAGRVAWRPSLIPVGPVDVATSREQFNLFMVRQDLCDGLPFVAKIPK
jgi:FkbM family methyltransferase